MIQRLHWNVLYLHICKMKSRAEKQRSVSVDQKHMQLIDLHTERVFMLQHAGFFHDSIYTYIQSWWLNVCIYRIMFLFSVSLRWYLTSHGVYSEWIKMCPVGDICWQVTVLCFLFEYKRRSFLSPRSHRLSVEPVKWPWLYLLQHASDPCLWPYASYCRGGGGTSDLTPHTSRVGNCVLCDKWSP